MDFLTEQFSADLIENGAWLHLLGPEGSPLFLDGPERVDPEDATKTIGGTKPCRFRIRSNNSEAYKKHLDDVQRRSMNQGRKAKGNKALQQEMMLKEMKLAEPETFANIITEVENVSKARPGRHNVPYEELLKFAMDPKNKPFVDQALTFSADESNYGTDAGNAAPAGQEG
jgi:hypothetical protein